MSQERFEKRRRAARWRRVLRYFLWLVAVGLIGAAVWLVWFSTVLTVTHVQVVGMTTMKARDIEAQAQVPFGLQLARVRIDPIETRVAQMERIDQVDVSRRWPHTLRIRVQERVPIAWVRSNGLIRQVDRTGVDFRTLDSKPDNLTEIRIFTTDPMTRQQALESVAKVVAFLRSDGRELFDQLKYVSAATQDSIKLHLSRGRTVVWGSAERGPKKVVVLHALLKIDASRYDVSAPELPTTKK